MPAKTARPVSTATSVNPSVSIMGGAGRSPAIMAFRNPSPSYESRTSAGTTPIRTGLFTGNSAGACSRLRRDRHRRRRRPRREQQALIEYPDADQHDAESDQRQRTENAGQARHVVKEHLAD